MLTHLRVGFGERVRIYCLLILLKCGLNTLNFLGHRASNFNFTVQIALNSLFHTVFAKQILSVINVSNVERKNAQNLKLVLQ